MQAIAFFCDLVFSHILAPFGCDILTQNISVSTIGAAFLNFCAY